MRIRSTAGPDTARLLLVGNMRNDDALAAVTAALASWRTPQRAPLEPPAVPLGAAPTGDAGHKVYLVDQPGQRQAVVMMAEPGIRLTDSCVHALDVFGSVLNGLGGALPCRQSSLWECANMKSSAFNRRCM